MKMHKRKINKNERDMSADEVDQPTVLLVKILNYRE